MKLLKKEKELSTFSDHIIIHKVNRSIVKIIEDNDNLYDRYTKFHLLNGINN